MGNPLKSLIQKQLYNNCYKKYEKEIAYQNNRYARFLEEKGSLPVYKFPSDAFVTKASQMLTATGKHVTVFYPDNGILEDTAVALFDAAFSKNPTCVAAYADQDYVDSMGDRHNPWFKPVWSPDTLADSFYVGSVFALRTSMVEKGVLETCNSIQKARELFCQVIQKSIRKIGVSAAGCSHSQVVRVEEILFHEFMEQPRKGVAEYVLRKEPVENPVFDLPIPASYPTFTFSKNLDKPLVSVVIPSKDNPEVLKRCLHSMKEKTQGISFEILVVDNGSGKEAKDQIAKLVEEVGGTYLYEKMDFNFSRMCNIGAKKAKGNYLLFLNDDMEIITSDWMVKMWEQACLHHVGAVGAKLYYPNSTVLQHAGVTNLEIGPAHKLQHNDDALSYYHGKNRGICDMLAVTAACLMVEKKKYNQVGGFCEEIAVAYNDVDFCFLLFEEGYYNVQRNDVTLYHYESYSRGNDELSKEKWHRLLEEKEKLYERHPLLRGKDPFYSPSLAGNFSDYLCYFEYDYEKPGAFLAKSPKPCKDPSKYENGCLMIKLEQKQQEKQLELKKEPTGDVRIEGWSYVLHNDSMRYKRMLILKHQETGNYYSLNLQNRYRKDVEEILTNESEHTALAGFYAVVKITDLPKGTYEIGMLAKDQCSSQRLFQMTEECMIVGNEPEKEV